MKVRYRVVEYKVPNEDKQRFFVEVGTRYRERYWAFFFVTKTQWETHSGHADFPTALKAINVLKQTEPIYHDIH